MIIRLFVGSLLLLDLAGGCAPRATRDNPPASPSASAPRYASPEEAWRALLAAVRSGSAEKIVAVVGEDARPLLSSGDPVDDARRRHEFLEDAEGHTTFDRPTRTRAVALVGEQRRMFPIPLVRDGGGWAFDTTVGGAELVERRIRQNELRAIAMVRSYIYAQHQYASLQIRYGESREYAQRFRSTPGKRDGLFWQADSEGESPMAPLASAISAEGYAPGPGGPESIPFHGYVYRILVAQGAHAPGGAHSYLKGTRMTRGFGLVAWPVEYGQSGRTTFIVNQDEIVYGKDLGNRTGDVVRGYAAYDPDASWTPMTAP